MSLLKAKKPGWLTNPARLERRNRANTLLSSHVKALIKKIDDTPDYTELDEEKDAIMRLRDKALLAMDWTFFLRGLENLALKLKDIYYDEGVLLLTVNVEKKGKSYRECPHCSDKKGNSTKNAKTANFCKNCGKDTSTIPLSRFTSKFNTYTLRKGISYYFCRFIVEWIDKLKELSSDPETLLFPSFDVASGRFRFLESDYGKRGTWKKRACMSVERLDQIWQRLDPTITSHFVRYGHPEEMKKLGYPIAKIQVIGRWSSDKPLRSYLERKGLTDEAEEFSKDERML